MRRNYRHELVADGIAHGDLAPDLDPELTTTVIMATTTEFHQLFLQRMGIASGTLADADATLFDTPEAHRLFDDLVRILERGLANSTAPT